MSQTRDQKRFTISEVAADWHELMIPQRTMRPSITRASEQLDLRFYYYYYYLKNKNSDGHKGRKTTLTCAQKQNSAIQCSNRERKKTQKNKQLLHLSTVAAS